MRLPRLPSFRLPENAAERAVTLAANTVDNGAIFFQRSYRGFWRFYRWGARAVLLLLGLAIFLASEVWLAMQVMDLHWYFVLGLFMVMIGLVFAASQPKAAFFSWLLLTPIVSKLFSLDWGAGLPALTFDRSVIYPLAGFMLLRSMSERRRVTGLTLGEILLVAFPLYIAACSPFLQTQSIPSLALSIMQRAGDIAILYFVTKALIKTQKDLAWLIGTVIAVGIYSSIMAFYDHFSGKMALAALIGVRGELRYTDAGGRAAGPFISSPGELGMYLGICLVLAVHAASWARSQSVRAVCWLSVCLMLPSLFWTYTRGSYLVFIACLMLMPFLARGNRRAYVAAGLVTLLAVGIAVPVIMSSSVLQDRFTNDRTSLQRLVAGASLLGILRENPLFGVGISNAYNEMPKHVQSVGNIPGFKFWFDSGYLSRSRLKLHAASHSTYLTLLAEHGLLGFGMYAGTLAAFCVSLQRMRRRWPRNGLAGSDYPSAMLALMAGLALSMNTTSLAGYEYVYYVPYVLVAAAVRLDETYARGQTAEQETPAAEHEDSVGSVRPLRRALHA